jgi:hypothetical protein
MSGRPSAYEYVQEWIWRFSKVEGLPKFVFLAIGRHLKRTKSGEFITPPLPAEAIRASIGMSEATVTRGLKAITVGPDSELEPVRSNQRGTVNRYRLRRALKLPLMDADPSAHLSDRRMASISETDDAWLDPSVSQTDGDRLTDGWRPSHRRMASGSATNGATSDAISLEIVRTDVLATAAEREAGADHFLRFAVEQYRTHNDGAVLTVTSADREIVLQLLIARTLERLEAMYVAFLTCQPEEDHWCAVECKRKSFPAFRHAADRLDVISRGRERQAHDSGDSAAARWATACDLLRSNPDVYDTWIAPLHPELGSSPRTLVLYAPSRGWRDRLPEDIEQRIRWAVKHAARMHVEFAWQAEQSTEAAS